MRVCSCLNLEKAFLGTLVWIVRSCSRNDFVRATISELWIYLQFCNLKWEFLTLGPRSRVTLDQLWAFTLWTSWLYVIWLHLDFLHHTWAAYNIFPFVNATVDWRAVNISRSNRLVEHSTSTLDFEAPCLPHFPYSPAVQVRIKARQSSIKSLLSAVITICFLVDRILQITSCYLLDARSHHGRARGNGGLLRFHHLYWKILHQNTPSQLQHSFPPLSTNQTYDATHG